MKNWIAPDENLLPDFIIGGAMKTGTTSLHNMLNLHPKIYIPSGEINFFDIDNLLQLSYYNFYNKKEWIYQSMTKHPKKMWDWYHDKFKEGESYIKGEDSTAYLSSKKAAQRISQQKKDIKLIFILRQPTARAYSNYWHRVKKGRAIYSFEDSLLYDPYEIVNRSLYLEQLENYYECIPKSRIKVILFEDLVNETELTLREISGFLNIDFEEFPEELLHVHSYKARVPKNPYLHVKMSYLLRKYGDLHYSNILPSKCPNNFHSTPYFVKLLNKVNRKLNPLTSQRPPKINKETKLFLDDYFFNALQGLDELVDKDILSKWFPDN